MMMSIYLIEESFFSYQVDNTKMGAECAELALKVIRAKYFALMFYILYYEALFILYLSFYKDVLHS